MVYPIEGLIDGRIVLPAMRDDEAMFRDPGYESDSLPGFH